MWGWPWSFMMVRCTTSYDLSSCVLYHPFSTNVERVPCWFVHQLFNHSEHFDQSGSEPEHLVHNRNQKIVDFFSSAIDNAIQHLVTTVYFRCALCCALMTHPLQSYYKLETEICAMKLLWFRESRR